MQDDQTAFDVASDRRNYKVIKALLKKKYPVRWRFKLQKLNSKRGSSLTRLPISPSTNSVQSDAESSVCSEINVTTSELDLDGVDD
jgi:ankyrin repeat protein